MNKKLKQQKLKMWKENLARLEEELEASLVKKSEVVQQGNLSEDAAYKLADEDAETYRVRIEEVKKIIAELEGKK